MNKELVEIHVNLLKKMHNFIIKEIGDEDVYMFWVMEGVPDCPTEEDLEFIAADPQIYDDVCALFGRLVARNYVDEV